MQLNDLRTTYRYIPELVVNIDQTAVYHGMTRRRTFERRGSRTVRVLENPLSSVRSTAILGITLSGHKLKPLVVFKGCADGRIAQNITTGREKLPSGVEYSVQRNAWSDERVMSDFIQKSLRPHLLEHPGRALLILDKYSVHRMESFRNQLASSSCDAIYIPGGLTPILQPLDIAVNKPFKDHIRDAYSRWARSTFDSELGLSKPTRRDIAEWVRIAWTAIRPETIVSGFRIADILQ
jgi:hypothetical protein